MKSKDREWITCSSASSWCTAALASYMRKILDAKYNTPTTSAATPNTTNFLILLFQRYHTEAQESRLSGSSITNCFLFPSLCCGILRRLFLAQARRRKWWIEGRYTCIDLWKCSYVVCGSSMRRRMGVVKSYFQGKQSPSASFTWRTSTQRKATRKLMFRTLNILRLKKNNLLWCVWLPMVLLFFLCCRTFVAFKTMLCSRYVTIYKIISNWNRQKFIFIY